MTIYDYGFEDTRANWNGYGETPPNSKAINLANKVFKTLLKLDLIPNKVIRSHEEVFFDFGITPVFASITADNFGDIIICMHNRSNGDPYAKETTLKNLNEDALELKQWINTQ